MKFAPIARPKQEIVVVGNDEVGTLHLLKLGQITPAENPTDLQQEEIRRDTISATIEKAAARLAEKLGTDRLTARNKLLAMSIKEADEDATAEPEFKLYDYLSREEINDMIRARENPMEIAIKVTTLFIRYRVAYPVVMTAPLKGKSTELQVEPLLVSVNKDSKIRFQNGVVTSAEFAEEQSEVIKVSADHGAIEASTGYVCEGHGYKLGFSDWTEQDTRENLTEGLIAEVYRFYLVESGQAVEVQEGNEATETETEKSLTSSNLSESPNESPSNGKKSTGSSNITELATVA